jgi:four helix bundle protein
MKDFRRLEVWEKAHALTLAVYKETKGFPAEERFGLTSQIRRAAASIPANISEGCGRGGDNEMARFLQIAMGSASELEYHLLLARDLGLLARELHAQLERLTLGVKQMLVALHRKITADKGNAARGQAPAH